MTGDSKAGSTTFLPTPSPRLPEFIQRQRTARRLTGEAKPQLIETSTNTDEDQKTLDLLNKTIINCDKKNIDRYIELHIDRGDFFLGIKQDNKALDDFKIALQNCTLNTLLHAKILNLMGISLIALGEKNTAFKVLSEVKKITLAHSDSKGQQDLTIEQNLAEKLIEELINSSAIVSQPKSAPTTPRP